MDETILKYLFMSRYTANVIAHHGVLDEGVHFKQKRARSQHRNVSDILCEDFQILELLDLGFFHKKRVFHGLV